MSQYFDIGDETLWNPSDGAAQLFLRQVAVFEAELGLPSGLGRMENDECQVDPVAFGVFTNSLLARHRRTGHSVLLALSEGFVATVLVLAGRAGVPVDWAGLEAVPDGPLGTSRSRHVRGCPDRPRAGRGRRSCGRGRRSWAGACPADRPRPRPGAAPPAGHPEQAVRCASCHSHTGQSVMPRYDSGYSVGSWHSTHSAYGGPSALGGFVASTIVQ
ncbi:hypothetical protein EDD94_5933 [Streptomyces sp. PanSC9]|nr:hypothetical protein EDD94_5933 [Streptomyces sp. PanSC9]